MPKRFLPFLAALFPLAASAAELVMVAPVNQVMPLAQFDRGVLTGGIIKDLSEAIGQRLGRPVRFVSASARRVAPTIVEGKADGVCYVRPFWIDGNFHWSRPLIPDAEVVAARIGAPVIGSLLALRDRPVATVAGYRYPRVEQVLGLRFRRIESATMEENLQKVVSGAAQYTLLAQSTLDYQMRLNKKLQLRRDLVFASFAAQCAFTRSGKFALQDLDKAIDGLVNDGSVERILSRYR